MKKIKKIILLMFAITLIQTISLDMSVKAKANSYNINITINGNKVNFSDQKPVIYANRVLIPLRFVTESLGAKIIESKNRYDNIEKIITISQETKIIGLQVNNPNVNVKYTQKYDPTYITLDVPPTLIKGHIFVPLRFISEALDAKIDWQKANNLITVKTEPRPTTPIQTYQNTNQLQFDYRFKHLAKALFKNNLIQKKNKITFTVPNNTEAYFQPSGTVAIQDSTKLMPGKTYTYEIGKGNGSVNLMYLDPTVKTSIHDPITSELYSIFLDRSILLKPGSSTNGDFITDDYKNGEAIVVWDITLPLTGAFEQYASVNEAITLAQSL